jgi:hypothetical protein
MMVKLPKTGIELPNDDGIITLLDNKGLKVHRVSYTGKDASKEGWTIAFENLGSWRLIPQIFPS